MQTQPMTCRHQLCMSLELLEDDILVELLPIHAVEECLHLAIQVEQHRLLEQYQVGQELYESM